MNDVRVTATVRIGVTGHRSLGNRETVRAGVDHVLGRLDKLLERTPHTFVAVSALAEGADRLVADAVLEWRTAGEGAEHRLEAVLPLPEQEYLQDFATEESKEEFRALLARAGLVRVIDGVSPRTAAYEKAGRWIVHHCDVLIAVWDGRGTGGQGGTAEIIEYARRVGRSIFRIDADTGRVSEERHADRALEGLGHLNGYNAEGLDSGETAGASEALRRDLARRAEAAGLGSEDAASLLAEVSDCLLPQFVRADRLAQRYQDRHARAGSVVYVLAAAAVATVAGQTLFLPDVPAVLWVEVLTMAGILAVLLAAQRGEWHRKWIDYRSLAERLRSALFLSIAGIDHPRQPRWTSSPPLQHEDWTLAALGQVWDARPQADHAREIPLEPLKKLLLDAWLGDQIEWFARKGARHRYRHEVLARAGEVLFGLTLVAAAVHAAGVAHGTRFAALSLSEVLVALAIVLPAVGAALAGIRMHREYLRNAERYAHMVRALAAIGEQIAMASSWEVFASLVHDANEVLLGENQDWRVLFLARQLEVA